MTRSPGHVVVVSPHLDDAVLSAFGLLTEASSATVLTVFAGVVRRLGAAWRVRPAHTICLTQGANDREA